MQLRSDRKLLHLARAFIYNPEVLTYGNITLKFALKVHEVEVQLPRRFYNVSEGARGSGVDIYNPIFEFLSKHHGSANPADQ